MGIPLRQMTSVGSLRGSTAHRGAQALSAGADARAPVPLQPRLRGLRQDRLSRQDPEPAAVASRSASRRSTSAARRSSRSPAASRCCTRRWPRSSQGIIARKKFVYLCTNALLMEKKLDQYEPSPYFVWSVHLDGNREHARPVGLPAGRLRHARSRRSARPRRAASASTSTARCSTASTPTRWRRSSTTCRRWASTASRCRRATPTSARPTRSTSSTGTRTKELFRDIFRKGRGAKKWSFNQSGLFLDFLAGNQDYHCTPWGEPDAQRLRLAAALLPARRRLRPELQGADGGDRLGRLRHRQLREVRRLHGPLAATRRRR